MLCTTLFTVNRISSQEVPSHLKDKNWQLKSDEGDGSVYFYASSIVLQPTVSVGGVQIPTWNLVATKTNFLAFRRYIHLKKNIILFYSVQNFIRLINETISPLHP